MPNYSKAQIDRIGNLLVYITNKLGPTHKTKLLKLIYILEEEAVKQSGVPFTDLSYTHLPKGPVATFVNTQIDKKRQELAQYINLTQEPESTLVSPAKEFNDDEFSEFDLQLIDEVLNRFGDCNGRELIEYTHRDGSLWKKLDDKYNGKPPKVERDFNLLALLDDEDVSEELRSIAKEEKAFIDYLTAKD